MYWSLKSTYGCREEQVHVLCTIEELMPSIGTAVPSPAVLAVALCLSDSASQNVKKPFMDLSDRQSSVDDVAHKNHSRYMDIFSNTYFISISDDGTIWHWLLTFGTERFSQRASFNVYRPTQVGEELISHTHIGPAGDALSTVPLDRVKEFELINNNNPHFTNSRSNGGDLSMKVVVVLFDLSLMFVDYH